MSDITFPTGSYSCIVADPPWPVKMIGSSKQRPARAVALPYETMSLDEIKALPVADIAAEGAHLWLWTTNGFLREAFDVMEAWGFKYLTTITWVKPNGLGAWFQSRTQHVLFGYRERCVFPLARYKPTYFAAKPGAHSQKPDEFYDLVRSISPEPRIDLFNRRHIEGFEGWGLESPDEDK